MDMTSSEMYRLNGYGFKAQVRQMNGGVAVYEAATASGCMERTHRSGSTRLPHSAAVRGTGLGEDSYQA